MYRLRDRRGQRCTRVCKCMLNENTILPLRCSSSTDKRHQQGPPPPPSKRPSPVYKRPQPPTKLSAQPSFQTPVLATRRPNNPPPPQSPNPNGYGAPPVRSGPAVQIPIATRNSHNVTYEHPLNLALFSWGFWSLHLCIFEITKNSSPTNLLASFTRSNLANRCSSGSSYGAPKGRPVSRPQSRPQYKPQPPPAPTNYKPAASNSLPSFAGGGGGGSNFGGGSSFGGAPASNFGGGGSSSFGGGGSSFGGGSNFGGGGGPGKNCSDITSG